uniref:Uncharacterized protein n=1 Tax=Aspergillus fumigatus TaxID=746128 RepID=Q6MYB9_ASPFM|nr:hypothetical protein AfA35g10.05b [Aspergillus fumigatus]
MVYIYCRIIPLHLENGEYACSLRDLLTLLSDVASPPWASHPLADRIANTAPSSARSLDKETLSLGNKCLAFSLRHRHGAFFTFFIFSHGDNHCRKNKNKGRAPHLRSGFDGGGDRLTYSVSTIVAGADDAGSLPRLLRLALPLRNMLMARDSMGDRGVR